LNPNGQLIFIFLEAVKNLSVILIKNIHQN